MRVGIHASVTGRGDNAVDELIQLGRMAHEHGLAFWTAQLGDIDALTALAVVGREVPGLDFGTAVVPTYPRHPMVMAMQALTVQAASGGRLALGIGLSHQMVIEGSFGLSFSTPIRHMREYLEILMPLLHSGQVAFEGKEFTARSMGPMKPAGATPPPVLVAALGSQMLNLTGRLADGTALWMVGPKTLAEHVVPAITKAAEGAGRPSPRVLVGLPVCVTADPGAARERAAKSFGFYNNLPSYRAMLDREGVAGPADVAVIGDEDQVAGQLRRLVELGATEFSLPLFGSSEERERTLSVLAALARE
jgi:5,10-methylenetetrahydromethanopterin reductase